MKPERSKIISSELAEQLKDEIIRLHHQAVATNEDKREATGFYDMKQAARGEIPPPSPERMAQFLKYMLEKQNQQTSQHTAQDQLLGDAFASAVRLVEARVGGNAEKIASTKREVQKYTRKIRAAIDRREISVDNEPLQHFQAAQLVAEAREHITAEAALGQIHQRGGRGGAGAA